MAWRIANSLLKLRAEVDAKFPGRSKSSDGGIGDAEHASRNSDHNPWVNRQGVGIVTAIDITHDPKSGCDSYALAELLRAMRDPRIKYIISNRKICAYNVSPWQWRKYRGANPHDHHVHISVRPEPEFYDDPSSWNLAEVKMPHTNEPQPKPVPPKLRRGDSGADVVKLQQYLNQHGFSLKEDGDFGGVTLGVVKIFQTATGLEDDGIVGPQTWKALLEGK